MQMVLAFATTAASLASSAGSAVMSGIGSIGSAIGGAGAGVSAAMSGATPYITDATGAITGGGGAAAGGGAFGMSTGVLRGLSFGGNVIGSLSQFAMNSMNQQATQANAFDEKMAARQEYIAAADKANEINRAFIDTMGNLTSDAAAGGIDVASGSVQSARRQAEKDADQALTINRNSADMNASLRRARASMLDQSAKTQGFAGVGGLGASLAKNILQLAGTG